MDEISFMGSHAGGRSVGRKHRMHLHLLPAQLPADGARVLPMKSLCAGIALACGVLLSSSALAAELGDITLTSALNEPLAAAIELEGLGGVSVADISVAIGDDAAYEQAGIERDPVLDDITVTIESTTADEGRILLASTTAVSEPFLNLIVTVSEPDGTTAQREYTLLLELPGDGVVTQAATQTATPPAASQPQPAAPAAASNSAQAYTVGAGDTLWEIAASTRPDSSVSVQQMMLAIQRANPDAFLHGNINTLLSGRVLRIPSQQDIAVIDRQAAIAQVSQQNTALGGQPLAGANTGGAGGGADARDQLRLVSGDAATGAGDGDGGLAATIAALENELMLSEENLDRARIENLELNNRLAALQEQIDLLENIIAMEDDRIAALQAELVQQAEATAQALASADNAAAAIEELNNQPAAGPAGLLRNGIVLLGALVVVVLAALGFLVHRRRQAQLVAEENQFNPAFADVDDDEAVAIEGAKPGLLAGLFARFRRNRDEDDLDEDDDYEADAVVAERQEPAAAAAAAYAATSDSTDRLRNEMGIDDVTASLGDALDRIDNEQAETSADVFAPVVDEEPVVADADEADMSFAIDAAADEEQTRDDDYAMTAADAAFAAADTEVADAEEAFVALAEDEAIVIDEPAAIAAVDATEPEAIEFTPVAAPEPVDVAAAPLATDDDEDIAETFEFTLKDLPETESPVSAIDEASQEPVEAIETFDFKLSTPAPAPAPEPEAPKAAESLEVIAFPGSVSAPAVAPIEVDDLPLELGDISFDDTTLIDDEDDSPFKPRSGNECDTKLDLATAYEAMGDVVEAIEILDEVIAEGSPAQVETAQRLKDSWQASL